ALRAKLEDGFLGRRETRVFVQRRVREEEQLFARRLSVRRPDAQSGDNQRGGRAKSHGRILAPPVLHFGHMRRTSACGLAALALWASASLAAWQEKPQLPKSQLPDLGRPTRPGDEQPPLNFGDYFTGKWNFEWDVPEGSLGPSGTIKGSVTY